MTTAAQGAEEHDGFSDEEKQLIGSNPQQIMRVWTIDNEQDSVLLHTKTQELPPSQINSDTYKTLISRMLVTVNDPANPGVGIAAPQVGILRRIVLVQRFDKEGEPFVAYVNPRIVEYSEDKRVGMEGCLSVPDRNGSVMRSEWVKITYTDPHTLQTVEERVEGFTAVIFQHEIDHLDGILYTDRINENRIRTISYTPRNVCSSQINVVAENDTIIAIEFVGGCAGNAEGLASLLEGMNVYDAIDRLEGIKCADKDTSCPDQLTMALRLMMQQEE